MEKAFLLDDVANQLRTLITWHGAEDSQECLLAIRVLIRDRAEQLYRQHGNKPVWIDYGHGRTIEITSYDTVAVVEEHPVVVKKSVTVPAPAAAFDHVFHCAREGT